MDGRICGDRTPTNSRRELPTVSNVVGDASGAPSRSLAVRVSHCRELAAQVEAGAAGHREYFWSLSSLTVPLPKTFAPQHRRDRAQVDLDDFDAQNAAAAIGAFERRHRSNDRRISA